MDVKKHLIMKFLFSLDSNFNYLTHEKSIAQKQQLRPSNVEIYGVMVCCWIVIIKSNGSL